MNLFDENYFGIAKESTLEREVLREAKILSSLSEFLAAISEEDSYSCGDITLTEECEKIQEVEVTSASKYLNMGTFEIL